tara:strand:+ start:392 stop:607 length:216 start_codon:yes stop_codon:yes gene_type:complete
LGIWQKVSKRGFRSKLQRIKITRNIFVHRKAKKSIGKTKILAKLKMVQAKNTKRKNPIAKRTLTVNEKFTK